MDFFCFAPNSHGDSKEHMRRRQTQFELDGMFCKPNFKEEPGVLPGTAKENTLSLRNQCKYPKNANPPASIGHAGALTKKALAEFWGRDIPGFPSYVLTLIQEREPPTHHIKKRDLGMGACWGGLLEASGPLRAPAR